MKVLVTHPTGNANVRAAIEGFASHDVLAEFNTTIATNPNSLWIKALPGGLRSELLRRKFEIEHRLIKRFPLREMGRLGFQKLGFKRMTRHEYGNFSVDAVYSSIDKMVANRLKDFSEIDRPDIVYAYEDGALATFDEADKLEITRVYDLPKGYWRAERELLGIERDKRPDWACTLAGFKDSPEKLHKKDLELKSADHIIVASTFTKNTLQHFPGNLAPITVIPYGFPPVIKERSYDYSSNRKLKLLFVGGLSQRKGIANVLESIAALESQVELTIIGRKSTEECIPLNEGIQKHRYISSLPHREVLREMSEHDIVLFPSLFEGFGLVVTEAMSQGTPVITTDRTCGPDMISNNVDGWMVEPGSTDSLTNQLVQILESPELVEKVGRAAMNTARMRPWAQYGDELVKAIYSIQKKKESSVV